jgi:hypothetical protein
MRIVVDEVVRQMTQLTRPWRVLLIAAVIAFGVSRPADASEAIAVTVDQATLIKLPDRVGTIVVGNPLIADVTVQSGGTMVLTGKSFGTTNLVALDRAGNVLVEKLVRVDGPQDAGIVVVYRGVERETYSCLPNCERRITLGDSVDRFNDAMAQAGARNTQAAGGAQPAAK